MNKYLTEHVSNDTGKGNTDSVHVIKAFDGSECSTSCPDCLTPGQRTPQFTFNKRLRGPQSWFEHFGAQKHFLPLLGIEIWTIQPVAF